MCETKCSVLDYTGFRIFCILQRSFSNIADTLQFIRVFAEELQDLAKISGVIKPLNIVLQNLKWSFLQELEIYFLSSQFSVVQLNRLFYHVSPLVDLNLADAIVQQLVLVGNIAEKPAEACHMYRFDERWVFQMAAPYT